MSQGEVLDIFTESMLVALQMAAPLLIVSIVIGLVVSIFQAATQIQGQTLTFVPKVLVIAFMLFLLGSSMINTLGTLMVRLFGMAAVL